MGDAKFSIKSLLHCLSLERPLLCVQVTLGHIGARPLLELIIGVDLRGKGALPTFFELHGSLKSTDLLRFDLIEHKEALNYGHVSAKVLACLRNARGERRFLFLFHLLVVLDKSHLFRLQIAPFHSLVVKEFAVIGAHVRFARCRHLHRLCVDLCVCVCVCVCVVRALVLPPIVLSDLQSPAGAPFSVSLPVRVASALACAAAS